MTKQEKFTLERISEGLSEPLETIMSIVKKSEKEVIEWILNANIDLIGSIKVKIGAKEKIISEKIFLDKNLTIKAILTKNKNEQTIHLIKQRNAEINLEKWKISKVDGESVKLSDYYKKHFN